MRPPLPVHATDALVRTRASRRRIPASFGRRSLRCAALRPAVSARQSCPHHRAERYQSLPSRHRQARDVLQRIPDSAANSNHDVLSKRTSAGETCPTSHAVILRTVFSRSVSIAPGSWDISSGSRLEGFVDPLAVFSSALDRTTRVNCRDHQGSYRRRQRESAPGLAAPFADDTEHRSRRRGE